MCTADNDGQVFRKKPKQEIGAQIEGPPEGVLRQCRDRIDRDAPPNEQENLMAITQVFARLRYNNKRLFQLFGGRKAMIESPVIQEILAEREHETTRKAIARFLEARFGEPAQAIQSELEAIDQARLDELLPLAATCRSLASFRKKLSS
jgi:hypothetical protein